MAVRGLTAGPGIAGLHARLASWLAPVRVPRYWCAAAFTVCALFATGVSLFSENALHRRWGLVAACAYAISAAAVLAWRRRGVDLALLVSVSGALIAPLLWNAATHRRQPEVSVIQRSAHELVTHHSPYETAAALATTHNPNAFNPYLPVMSLFGVPRAEFGSATLADPRVWFGVAFLVLFALALLAVGAQHVIRWTLFVAATPVIAFELAVGGTDIPILALMCLGLALLWRRPRHVLAGLAIGVAAAAKATAWPAIVVIGVLVLVRDGKGPLMRFLVAAVAACGALIGPVALLWPGALVANTIMFPLGLANVTSPAASPLPGHLLATTGHTGHLIAVGLLILAGMIIATLLVYRPPRDVASAAWYLIIGLTLMFLLAPATRFGYFIYPAALLAWLQVAMAAQRRATAEAVAEVTAATEQAASQPA